MSDFCRYTIKEADKIKKICGPLHQHFGVKHFWYSKTTPEGGYCSLASNPEMHDYYHSSHLHLHSPFFHNPELISPAFYFYNAIQDQKFQESFDTCSSKLQIYFGGSLVLKQGKTMYRFGYGFDKAVGEYATNLIINHLPILKKFNEYFVKEAQEIIKKAAMDLVDLPTVMGAAYNQPPVGLGPLPKRERNCKFLENLGHARKEQLEKLTCRELEILQSIHEGLSARLIAERLYLSSRTVEKHIEMIKNKLNCNSKAELSSLANLLHIAGFFSLSN